MHLTSRYQAPDNGVNLNAMSIVALGTPLDIMTGDVQVVK